VGSAACCLWKVGSEGLRGKSQGGDSLWWVVLFSFCLQLDRPMALSSCNILFFELNLSKGYRFQIHSGVPFFAL
jgi:hypothetical protein